MPRNYCWDRRDPPIRVGGNPDGDTAPLSSKQPTGHLSCETMRPYLHSSLSPLELLGKSGRFSGSCRS
jgi:hypothetical protein